MNQHYMRDRYERVLIPIVLKVKEPSLSGLKRIAKRRGMTVSAIIRLALSALLVAEGEEVTV